MSSLFGGPRRRTANVRRSRRKPSSSVPISRTGCARSRPTCWSGRSACYSQCA